MIQRQRPVGDIGIGLEAVKEFGECVEHTDGISPRSVDSGAAMIEAMSKVITVDYRQAGGDRGSV